MRPLHYREFYDFRQAVLKSGRKQERSQLWYLDHMKSDSISGTTPVVSGRPESSYTQVKICGLTSAADAVAACEYGADAIGLVFYPPSSRNVSFETAAEIIRALPPFVAITALFLDADKRTVDEALATLPLSLLQFHGTESPEFCRSFDRPYIKSVAMKSESNVQSYAAQYTHARGFLLDSNVAGGAGGSGEIFDWSRIPNDFTAPLILAGGLDCNNVTEAVVNVRPTAVDVSSGVESSKGVKDHGLMQRFIQRVRAADSTIVTSVASNQ